MQWSNRFRDEEGATAAMVVLGIAALLGAALVAIDGGSVLMTRRGLVADTDAAAVGTALHMIETPCASKSDAGAEAAIIAAANDPATTVVADLHLAYGPCSEAGRVEVWSENPAPLFFAPIFGVDAFDAAAYSQAVYGRIIAMEGLRPIGLCAQEPHYLEWLAYANGAMTESAYRALSSLPDHPNASYPGAQWPVHRIPFQRLKDGQAEGACSPTGAPGPAGNWGFLNFDGGANSNRDLNDWLLGGYPGRVALTGPDCNDQQAGPDDCPGDPGGGGNSTRPGRDSLICPAHLPADDDACQTIWIVVYDQIRRENPKKPPNGANARFRPATFLGLVVRGFSPDFGTGKPFDESSYMDFEFVDELTDGEIGPFDPNATFPGPRGVQLCASEHWNTCPFDPDADG